MNIKGQTKRWIKQLNLHSICNRPSSVLIEFCNTGFSARQTKDFLSRDIVGVNVRVLFVIPFPASFASLDACKRKYRNHVLGFSI